MKLKLLSALLALLLTVSWVVPARAQTYGAAYITTIAYQNVSDFTASGQFLFYSAGSSSSTSLNYSLAAHAVGTLNIGSLSLTTGFKGSAVMTSNQQVVATLVQVPSGANPSKMRPLSSALTTGTSSILLGTALKNTFSTNSIIAIQNTDSVNNNFAVYFYPVGSTTPAFIDTTGTSIPPGAIKYYDLGTITGLGSAFNGSAVVAATRTSNGTAGSAVATAMELSTAVGGTAASGFEGTNVGSTIVYMPSAMCQYSSGPYNSNFALQNTSNLATADVDINFYPGGVATNVQIPPYGKVSVNACTSGNPAGWLGSATIVSSEPLIVIGKISGGGLATAFLGATTGAPKVALPYVNWASQANYDNGTRHRSFITIQNVDLVSTSGNITVKYYNSAGTLISTHTITTILAPGDKVNSNPNWQTPSSTTYEFGYSPAEGGSAIVEGPSDSKLAVVVRVSSKVNSTTLAGEDYSGILVSSGASTPYIPLIMK